MAKVDRHTNLEKYCTILQDFLLPEADCNFGENWMFQQDNFAFHTPHYTKQWLESNEAESLDWPAKHTDISVIDNVWGQMARAVYCEGKK